MVSGEILKLGCAMVSAGTINGSVIDASALFHQRKWFTPSLTPKDLKDLNHTQHGFR